MIDRIAATMNRHHQKAILVFITIGILLLSFGIYERLTPTVRIEWSTESEVDTLGFNLVREDESDPADEQQINPQLILAQGSPISGLDYHFIDRDVQPGKTYMYRLVEINNANEIIELESIEFRVKQKGLIEIIIALLLFSTSIVIYITGHKSQPGNQP